jgi:hypothetical protein
MEEDMEKRYMTEMSLDDQQKVRGGDWITSTIVMVEFVSMILGTL